MEKNESKFIKIGNHPSLDFINTQLMNKGKAIDLLEDLTDLVHWLGSEDLLTTEEAGEAIKRWDETDEAGRVMDEARMLRAVLRDAVESLTKGGDVPQAALDEVNRLFRRDHGYNELVRSQTGLIHRVSLNLGEPSNLLVPIAKSAGELFCHGDRSLIKRCENPSCILFFYDTTKNHRRRWCSMEICGNRIKAAAFYQRRRRMDSK